MPKITDMGHELAELLRKLTSGIPITLALNRQTWLIIFLLEQLEAEEVDTEQLLEAYVREAAK